MYRAEVERMPGDNAWQSGLWNVVIYEGQRFVRTARIPSLIRWQKSCGRIEFSVWTQTKELEKGGAMLETLETQYATVYDITFFDQNKIVLNTADLQDSQHHGAG